ncbi:hydrogenase formation protein HypD [Candidatus Entotheonella palauensis]|uniref:Hydrogenase formation protein HypD n=1 Tax=Candidatus Entotheonella gemina TaxID=1429439 RepID=W4MAW1_9BACT|nr:hydrogenase formation protein HypD [Candidatus Entotheonella palauensis]ETX07519.1 MAG: hydrogenase formation protein HypD [Candidatus Entotheonella gemina]
MKYIDEYRSEELAKKLVAEIAKIVTQNWVIMEVCGGQTHSIVKFGLDTMLPDAIELVHGPGCPVCVTPLEMIDQAHAIAARPGVIFTSFADMLRVPGSQTDLFRLKAQGADVRVIYSPLDALKMAKANPDKQVVFFGIGFETTAPANAMAVWRAHQDGLANFSMLVSHVLVPPAMTAILQAPHNRVRGFLAAGHVCAIMGWEEYEPIAAHYRVPIVVTGFEPLDILEGICMTVRQLEAGTAEVENQYARVVKREGNLPAKQLIRTVFDVCDRQWRGIGVIPQSGYTLKNTFEAHDAAKVFEVKTIQTQEPADCISGEILQGIKTPHDCSAFGKACSPEHPLGATMVSEEGACAAFYRYGRHLQQEELTL